MPLKPSGQTPTSSPPLSIRWASSLQASVAPPLRASSPMNGVRNTRSAPSGRRCRPVASLTDAIVIRPSTGTVPEWLETTSAPPSAGMFSAPRTSTRNHLSFSGRIAASRNRSVISGSKPYSSTSKSPATLRRRNASISAVRCSHRSPKTSTAADVSACTQSPTGMPPVGVRSRSDNLASARLVAVGASGSTTAGGAGGSAGGGALGARLGAARLLARLLPALAAGPAARAPGCAGWGPASCG